MPEIVDESYNVSSGDSSDEDSAPEADGSPTSGSREHIAGKRHGTNRGIHFRNSLPPLPRKAEKSPLPQQRIQGELNPAPLTARSMGDNSIDKLDGLVASPSEQCFRPPGTRSSSRGNIWVSPTRGAAVYREGSPVEGTKNFSPCQAVEDFRRAVREIERQYGVNDD
jgi:hypothetical protein